MKVCNVDNNIAVHVIRHMTEAKKGKFTKHLSKYIGEIQDKKQLLQKAFNFNDRKKGDGFVIDDMEDSADEKLNRSEFILEVMQNSRFDPRNYFPFSIIVNYNILT